MAVPPPPPNNQKTVELEWFTIQGEGEESIFIIKDIKPPATKHKSPSLLMVLRQYIPQLGQSKQVDAKQAYNVLGRLKSLESHLSEYNRMTRLEDEDEYCRYIKYHVLNSLSVFGLHLADKSATILVQGLTEFIANVSMSLSDRVNTALQAIELGNVDFEALGELYKPFDVVLGQTGIGIASGFRVLSFHYQERRTLFGIETTFHLTLEYVAALGEHFSLVPFEYVVTAWKGAKHRSINDLDFVPLKKESLMQDYINRGLQYDKIGRGVTYMAYKPGSLFLHSQTRSQSVPAASSSGRIMLDINRASQLGHYAAQGVDDASLALIQVTGRYRRAIQNNEKQNSSESLFLFTKIPTQLYPVVWPALVGYSFTAKAWAHVLVTGLHPIQFKDDAFDALVLDPQRKRLIKSLVVYGSEAFDDVIPGKSGGSVFLLHGPPGVGKTLTAEAIAEVLHRPLYYVTMGELGIDPVEMEKKLSHVLDLCSGWDALVLLDEADVFLEKRATSDIVRNAMVCVMLRLLEYHQGILFLTTNRVTEFDPAFESRVTVALRYAELTPEARAQVWKNLISKTKHSNVDFGSLGRHVMNGRQIKNAVRLSLALAKDSEQPITHELIEETIGIAAMGREEIRSAQKY